MNEEGWTMNSQERDVISGIFERLRSVADAPRDPEAERFIAELVARQPYAPYAMAQAIYVQEQALKELNDKVRDLEAQLKAAGGGEQRGFLGSLFGAGTSEQAPMPAQPSRTSVPQAGMGTAPQYGSAPGSSVPQQFPPVDQPAGGGGFLQGALAAAAGVAGGALLYQGLKGLLGGDEQRAAHRFGDTGRASDDRASGFGDPDNFLRNASHAHDGEDNGGSDDSLDIDLSGDDDLA
jgi:uncharacterized protein